MAPALIGFTVEEISKTILMCINGRVSLARSVEQKSSALWWVNAARIIVPIANRIL